MAGRAAAFLLHTPQPIAPGSAPKDSSPASPPINPPTDPQRVRAIKGVVSPEVFPIPNCSPHQPTQVYESIKGVVSPEALAHFDVEGEDLLYELRFLSIKQRAPAAAYIAAQNLRWAGLASGDAWLMGWWRVVVGGGHVATGTVPQVAHSFSWGACPELTPLVSCTIMGPATDCPAAPRRARCWRAQSRSMSGATASRRALPTALAMCWPTSSTAM